jgi:hypothetical protein
VGTHNTERKTPPTLGYRGRAELVAAAHGKNACHPEAISCSPPTGVTGEDGGEHDESLRPPVLRIASGKTLLSSQRTLCA